MSDRLPMVPYRWRHQFADISFGGSLAQCCYLLAFCFVKTGRPGRIKRLSREDRAMLAELW